ncbi:hypothetical protein [Nonomuraea cavernae]|uniref:hypothetical protein n=1 Tax=Nonomuraea cavernae TaxID=2045107 RepID=UPI0033EBB160
MMALLISENVTINAEAWQPRADTRGARPTVVIRLCNTPQKGLVWPPMIWIHIFC